MLIRGSMHEVYHSVAAKPFVWLGRAFGALLTRQGRDIPVEVVNSTRSDEAKSMFWHRTFSFPGEVPQLFVSRMEYVSGREIIEYVGYGMGIRMQMCVNDGALVYESCGYRWTFGGWSITIPEWLFLGHATIEEYPVDDERFGLDFRIMHPLFGKTFAYAGEFSIADSQ